MSGLGLGLGLGLGAHRKVGGAGMPDWDMTFTAPPTLCRIGWKDMPSAGSLQTLIEDGFVDGELDGVTATIDSAYVTFTGITADTAIRIKKTANITYLYLSGSSINWTGSEIGDINSPPNMASINLFNFTSIGATMTPAQFSGIIISLAYNVGTLPATVTINELPDMTYDGDNAVDWGEMVGDSFVPSDLAIALKTVVKEKGAAINLTAAGLTMPDETDDGDGFPEGFGDWWRIEE